MVDRSKDFRQFLQQLSDSDERAKMETHEASFLSEGRGGDLEVDTSVDDLREKYGSALEGFFEIVDMSHGIEEVAKELGEEERVRTLLGFIGSRNFIEDGNAMSELEKQLDDPALLPFWYKVLSLSRTDHSVERTNVYRVAAMGARHGGAEAVPSLIDGLDGQASSDAAGCLGEIGDVRALEPLLSLVERMQSATPGRVYRAIGAFRDRKITDVLLKRLSDDASNNDISSLVWALGEAGDARATEALIEKVNDDSLDPNVRAVCIEALGKVGDERAFSAVVALIHPDNTEFFHFINEAVSQLLPRVKEVSSEQYRAILSAAPYDSMYPKLKEKLGQMDDGKVAGIIHFLLNDSDEKINTGALKLLVDPPIDNAVYVAVRPALCSKISATTETYSDVFESALSVMIEQNDVPTIAQMVFEFRRSYLSRARVSQYIIENIEIALPILEPLFFSTDLDAAQLEFIETFPEPVLEGLCMSCLSRGNPTAMVTSFEAFSMNILAVRRVEAAVKPIVNYLESESGAQAVKALTAIGGEIVVDEIGNILLHSKSPKLLKRACEVEVVSEKLIVPYINKMGSYEESQGPMDALSRLLKSEIADKVTQKLIEAALGKLEGVEAGAEYTLRPLARDLLTTWPSITFPAVNALCVAKGDAKWETQEDEALFELFAKYTTPLVNPLLETALKNGNHTVRMAAAFVIKGRKIASAARNVIIPLLEGECSHIETDEARETRATLIETLGELDTREGILFLIDRVENPLPSSRDSQNATVQIGKSSNVRSIPFCVEHGFIGTAVKNYSRHKASKNDDEAVVLGEDEDEGYELDEKLTKKLDRIQKIYKPLEGQIDTLAKIISLTDDRNIAFLERFVGQFSKRSGEMASGLLACFRAQPPHLTPENKDGVWLYFENVRYLTPRLYAEYSEARDKEEFFAEVESLISGMVTSGADSKVVKAHRLYDDVLKSIYTNNSGTWGEDSRVVNSPDHTDHLAAYNYKPRYTLDMGASTDLVLKEGRTLDLGKLDPVKKQFYAWSESWQQMDFDNVAMLADIERRIDEQFKKIPEVPWARTADTVEQKLFVLMIVAIKEPQFADEVKNLMIGYQFSKYEDIRAYIKGTTDRVAGARNADYAYLGELHAFFGDQIKEVSRKLIEEVGKEKWLAGVLPGIFSDFASRGQRQQIDRLNPKRELDMDSFRQQISSVLAGGKKGKLRTNDEGAPIHNWSAAKEMVRAKRGRLARIAQAAGNEQYTDPARIHLGEITLEELMGTEANMQSGKYNPERFSKYIAQKMLDIFNPEKKMIEEELDKFQTVPREVLVAVKKGETEDSQGVKTQSFAPKKLYGYITKNSTSAHARKVGGVCVSGDRKQWDDPAYLQMALHDPEDLSCKGCILMHVWEHDGNKYLIASLNPSSSYLYSVDEKSVLEQINAQLIDFAKENGIKGVGYSTNVNIRTNRTGGEFERAMKTEIAAASKTFGPKAQLKFATSKPFSYNPQYSVDDVDLIWIDDETAMAA